MAGDLKARTHMWWNGGRQGALLDKTGRQKIGLYVKHESSPP